MDYDATWVTEDAAWYHQAYNKGMSPLLCLLSFLPADYLVGVFSYLFGHARYALRAIHAVAQALQPAVPTMTGASQLTGQTVAGPSQHPAQVVTQTSEAAIHYDHHSRSSAACAHYLATGATQMSDSMTASPCSFSASLCAYTVFAYIFCEC